MKTFKLLSMLVFVATNFSSCSGDDTPQLLAVESEQVRNLFAPTTSVNGPTGPTPDAGEFTKFNFSTGQMTTSETDWDIAFRSTAIIVNGGVSLGATDEPERNGNAAVYIVDDVFADVNEVDTSLFTQDSETNYAIIRQPGMGWYNYEPFPANLIKPIPGRVLVFRTHDGRYAKVEIISYYKDAPNDSELDASIHTPRYYTFNYVYQPNEGETSF